MEINSILPLFIIKLNVLNNKPDKKREINKDFSEFRLNKVKMIFILKSEQNARKGIFCPFCNQYQVKLLERQEYYSKYACWNEKCNNTEVIFVCLNDLISNEEQVNFVCNACRSKLMREFCFANNNLIYLSFRCSRENCKNISTNFTYNLSKNRWEGDFPSLKNVSDFSNSQKEIHEFDDILKVTLFLLKREERALSSIEIYRFCYREKLLKSNKDFTWTMVGKLIKQEINQNRESSLFIELKQGVYDIRGRIQLIKEKDTNDQIKEEYDWAYFEPVSRIIYQNKNLIIKKQINFLIPEISAYVNSLDIDEKRDFLNSDGFKWRRKLGTLNLNNKEKKTIFVENLMKENFYAINNSEHIDLELNLDQNVINSDKSNSLFKKIGKVKFIIFKYGSVNLLK